MSKDIIVSFDRVNEILIRMERCQLLLRQLCCGVGGTVHEGAVAAAADLLVGIFTDLEEIVNRAEEVGYDQ